MEGPAPETIRRRQLDRALSKSAEVRESLPSPQRGWIAEVRTALGMTTRQLAARLGISQPGLVGWERAEADGVITLKNLRRAAEALDCTLVYSFVPNQSLDAMVQGRALEVARQMAQEVAVTMALEDQAPDETVAEDIVTDLAQQLARESSHELWRIDD